MVDQAWISPHFYSITLATKISFSFYCSLFCTRILVVDQRVHWIFRQLLSSFLLYFLHYFLLYFLMFLLSILSNPSYLHLGWRLSSYWWMPHPSSHSVDSLPQIMLLGHLRLVVFWFRSLAMCTTYEMEHHPPSLFQKVTLNQLFEFSNYSLNCFQCAAFSKPEWRA